MTHTHWALNLYLVEHNFPFSFWNLLPFFDYIMLMWEKLPGSSRFPVLQVTKSWVGTGNKTQNYSTGINPHDWPLHRWWYRMVFWTAVLVKCSPLPGPSPRSPWLPVSQIPPYSSLCPSTRPMNHCWQSALRYVTGYLGHCSKMGRWISVGTEATPKHVFFFYFFNFFNFFLIFLNFYSKQSHVQVKALQDPIA